MIFSIYKHLFLDNYELHSFHQGLNGMLGLSGGKIRWKTYKFGPSIIISTVRKFKKCLALLICSATKTLTSQFDTSKQISIEHFLLEENDWLNKHFLYMHPIRNSPGIQKSAIYYGFARDSNF